MGKKFMTQADYSRRLNVTDGYIAKLLKQGKIKLVDGYVDVEATDRAIKAGRQHHQPSKAAKAIAAAELREKDLDKMSVEDLVRLRKELATGAGIDTKEKDRLLEVRIESYEQRARMARLKADEKQGQLVDRKIVESEIFELLRGLRDNLLTIPDRLSHELSGLTDSHAIHTRLTAEIRQVLGDATREISTPEGDI